MQAGWIIQGIFSRLGGRLAFLTGQVGVGFFFFFKNLTRTLLQHTLNTVYLQHRTASSPNTFNTIYCTRAIQLKVTEVHLLNFIQVKRLKQSPPCVFLMSTFSYGTIEFVTWRFIHQTQRYPPYTQLHLRWVRYESGWYKIYFWFFLYIYLIYLIFQHNIFYLQHHTPSTKHNFHTITYCKYITPHWTLHSFNYDGVLRPCINIFFSGGWAIFQEKSHKYARNKLK